MIGDPSGKSDERNLLDDDDARGERRRHPRRSSRACSTSTPAERGAMIDEQRRLDARRRLPRVPARHRQVPDHQLHDGEGLGEARASRATPASATPSSRTCCCRRSTSCSFAKAHGCRLQVGGSDQYGNITAGCELSRKMGGAQLFGLTAPLLLDSTGQKMGKTSTGERVWLDPERTPPYRVLPVLVQRDATRTRRGCSSCSRSRPLAEIDELLRAHDADRAKRIAQRELARALTSWVHGDARDRARRGSEPRDVRRQPRRRHRAHARAAREGRAGRRDRRAPSSRTASASSTCSCRTVAESKSAARRLVAARRRVRQQRPNQRRRAQGHDGGSRDADAARRARRP